MLKKHWPPSVLTCASPRLQRSACYRKGSMGIQLLSLSVITAGAAEAQRAKETNSDMIKEEKKWAMNQSACICKESGLERIWATPHRHSHTSEGEGTFISPAGLCATGAKAKGEERTREGTHSSSLHSQFFFWKGNSPASYHTTSCYSVCQQLIWQIEWWQDNWSGHRKNLWLRTCILYF